MDPGKPVVWLHGEIKTPPFSFEARIEAGVLIRRLQRSEKLSMPYSRPMPKIGSRCHELRVVDKNETWRIVYATEPDAIVILEVFGKKTRQTPDSVLLKCRQRLMAYRTTR